MADSNSSDLFGQPIAEGRYCTVCNKFKTLEDFGFRQKAQRIRFRHCRQCASASALRYIHKRCKRDPQHKLTLRERSGWSMIRKKYGLTREQYQAMHDEQQGLCLICGQPETTYGKGKLRKLAVDHAHDETHRVRGLLCSTCNNGLGCFKDNHELLLKAIEYLNTH